MKDVFFLKKTTLLSIFFLFHYLRQSYINPFFTWGRLVIDVKKLTNIKLACDFFQPWIFLMQIPRLFFSMKLFLPYYELLAVLPLGSMKLFLDN